MKKICFSIPCYNEEDNVELIAQAILNLFEEKYSGIYDCVIEFIDNCSTDNTRNIIEKLCVDHPNNVKAIFNARNFGGVSSFYGLLQTNGDCSIVFPCDFQIPISVIEDLLQKWEHGADIVCAIKRGSKEKRLMWHIRKAYYHIMQKNSEISQIAHFTGAGLYDKGVVCWLKTLDDPIPSLRGMAAEYGGKIQHAVYLEEKRKQGKSKHNLCSLFSVALKNIIIYTDLIPNLALYTGGILCASGGVLELIFLIIKICNWSALTTKLYPLFFAMMILFGLQFIFMGLLGKYLSVIHKRIMKRPLVIEEKRLNF